MHYCMYYYVLFMNIGQVPCEPFLWDKAKITSPEFIEGRVEGSGGLGC